MEPYNHSMLPDCEKCQERCKNLQRYRCLLVKKEKNMEEELMKLEKEKSKLAKLPTKELQQLQKYKRQILWLREKLMSQKGMTAFYVSENEKLKMTMIANDSRRNEQVKTEEIKVQRPSTYFQKPQMCLSGPIRQ